MIKYLFILLLFLPILSLADTFGNTTGDGGGEENIDESRMELNAYTTTSAGTCTKAYFYGHDAWSGADTLKLVIYNDNSDTPVGGSLVGASDTIFVTTSVAGWWEADCNIELAASTKYWIGVWNANESSNSAYSFPSGSTPRFYGADATPLDDPCAAAGYAASSFKWGMYFDFTPSAGGETSTRRRKSILGGN